MSDLLNFAQSDRRLRKVARRILHKPTLQRDLFADPASPDAPQPRVVVRRRPVGEIFRVLQYCTQILQPGAPPARLSINNAAMSLISNKRIVRQALRVLVSRGYLRLHGRAPRGVGLYTIAVIRNGGLTFPESADGAIPALDEAA